MSEPPNEQRPLKAHWVNPWSEAIRVPLERLAECCASESVTAAELLAHWRTYDAHGLDAYILPRPLMGLHYSVGVRFGHRPQDYLSPYAHRTAAVRALIEEYDA